LLSKLHDRAVVCLGLAADSFGDMAVGIQGKSDRLVIGLTGSPGSGVSTTARALQKNGFRLVKLSDQIKRELAKREGLADGQKVDETTVADCRKKLQDIGNEGRKKAKGYWLEKLEINGTDEIVIDGIRNFGEAMVLRSQYPKFFLLALHASRTTLWERMKGLYDGNSRLFERDLARDSAEDFPEGQQVSICVQQSDYVFENEADAGSSVSRDATIFSRLEKDLELMRRTDDLATGSYCRQPTPDEVQMATAFSQSHMSRCLKRKVGAVIISPQDIPLSLGYNENPVGMQPCLTQYKHCFKDEDMHKKLEKMDGFMCPRCGKEIASMRTPWKCANPDCRENLKLVFFPSRNMELCTAIHAEERAIRSLGGRSAEGGTLFVTTCPCFQCARYIVDAGIKRVVYVEAYAVIESEEFLRNNGVGVDPFSGFKASGFNRVFKQMV
jgi:deoxycytidylate deaminase/dephospho-CoA kinase